MRLLYADHALTGFISDLLAADMADALIRNGTDLSDDTAIAFCLIDAGFGSASIAELMDEARSLAARATPYSPPRLTEIFA